MAGAGVAGLVEVEAVGSVRALAAVLVEAASVSDSDSVSVKSKGRLIRGVASMKLKGSTSVPRPKKVTSKVNNSLVSDPARAIVRCCKPSFLKAAAFPSNSAARRKRCKD